jgi:hypothetical protein
LIRTPESARRFGRWTPRTKLPGPIRPTVTSPVAVPRLEDTRTTSATPAPARSGS